MLEFQKENDAIDAAQIRVTPQELTEALRTVEESKAAEARVNEETLPLGEAIQALGLNYSPEEVLEAVKAHRARREQTTPILAVHTPRRRTGSGIVMAVATVCFVMGICTLWRSSVVQSSAQAPAIAVVSPVPVASPSSCCQLGSHCQLGSCCQSDSWAADKTFE